MLYKILSVSSPAYLPQSFLYEQNINTLLMVLSFQIVTWTPFLLQIQ